MDDCECLDDIRITEAKFGKVSTAVLNGSILTAPFKTRWWPFSDIVSGRIPAGCGPRCGWIESEPGA